MVFVMHMFFSCKLTIKMLRHYVAVFHNPFSCLVVNESVSVPIGYLLSVGYRLSLLLAEIAFSGTEFTALALHLTRKSAYIDSTPQAFEGGSFFVRQRSSAPSLTAAFIGTEPSVMAGMRLKFCST